LIAPEREDYEVHRKYLYRHKQMERNRLKQYLDLILQRSIAKDNEK